MAKKNLIFCEVSCGRCGRAANNCGYYSPDLIKRLKTETKDWIEDLSYRILCPECQKELEKNSIKSEISWSFGENK